MIVCDICGKQDVIQSYVLPTKVKYYAMKNGQRIASLFKYEDKPVDLCEACRTSLADLIYDCKLDSGVIEDDE